jgi:hypothetical protein
MRTRRVLLASFAALTIFSVSAFAKQNAPPPLPPELMQAKTIYVQNFNATRKDLRECNDELSKWGQFRVVSDPKDADIIIRIRRTFGNGGLRVTSTSVSSTISSSVIIDVMKEPSAGILWSDWRADQGFRSGVNIVMKALRKHFEEQEKAEGKAR